MPFQTILPSIVQAVSLQKQLRTTSEWIQHNLYPPEQERADGVPIRSREADVMAALSLYDAVDCQNVSENSVILASLVLNPELSEAWTRHGINFEWHKEGDVPHSYDDRAEHEMPEEMELQLWTSALSYSLDARKIAEMTEDPDWLGIKADHVIRHDNWIHWECLHLVCNLRFGLIPCATDPTCFKLHLLSSLTVYPQQMERRVRDQEMLQHIRIARAEHILDSHPIRAYVPPYDPTELEEWTSHMDAHSRAGIHQLSLLIKKEVAQMAPGRKRKQLSAAIHHMLRDVMALR
eukprot:3530589-Rhodomonas_salina.3